MVQIEEWALLFDDDFNSFNVSGGENEQAQHLSSDCCRSRNASGLRHLPPSTAVSYHVGFTLVNSSNTAIADLASMNSAGLDQQLMISTPGRILVSAQVQIQNPGGLAVRGACQMLMSDGTGPTNGLTVIGRPAVWFTTVNAAYDLVVPVLGYAEKKTGKYNVVVECQQLGVSGGTVAILGNMIVWEAAK